MINIVICDDREEILHDLEEKIKAADVRGGGTPDFTVS